MKNRCFFHRIFPKLLSFFSTWRLSRNIVIYVSKPTFSFFHFLFFRRKLAKNRWKNETQKKLGKWPQEGPQMNLILGVFFVVLAGLEKKGPKKYVFWGVDFWWFFGWPKKSFPGVIPGIDFSKNQPQASLGDLGGWTKTTQVLVV